MVRNPVTFGIYSYYDLAKEKTISYRIPYINSFDIQKDSDNLTVRAKVCLPKNILYDIKKNQYQFAASIAGQVTTSPTVNPSDIQSSLADILTGGKPNSPYFYEIDYILSPIGSESSTIDIVPNGLQVLNQLAGENETFKKDGYDFKKFEWVSLDKLPGTQLGYNNSVSKDMIVCNLNDPNNNYVGKTFTFDPTFDYAKATTFTIDSKIPDIELPTITKIAKSKADQDLVTIFSVGDLFTIRHGLLESVSVDGDKLKTDSFYITKVIPTENEIELHLENFTWKLRQIPAKGTISKTISLYDFMYEYVFPVILKETYINAIVSRDAESLDGPTPPNNDVFSKLTNNLQRNTLNSGFYLPITNFYDILNTLKEQFLINFVNVDYLGSACVSCSIGYAYRNVSDQYKYTTNRDITSKDMTKITYDDYKLLVRLTSNREPTKGDTKALKASVTKKTTTNQYNQMKANQLMIGRVIYGDRGVLGFVTSNSSRLGQQTLTSGGNTDGISIVNYTKLYYDKENLYELAIKIYRKLKFASSLNSIKTLPFLDGSPGLYDIISLNDTRNGSINGNYIVSSISYNMDVNSGYSQNISFGVQIPFDQLNTFVKEINN
jgi:hypothetical protein